MDLLNLDPLFVWPLYFSLIFFGGLIFAFLQPYSTQVKSYACAQFYLFYILFFSLHILFPSFPLYKLLFSGLAMLAFFSCVCLLFQWKKFGLFDYFVSMLLAFLLAVLFFVQLWMMMLLFYLLLILLKLFVDRFSQAYRTQKHYALLLSFQSFDMIERVDALLSAFDLEVMKREIEKKGAFVMRIDYQCNALMQHLFFKKLCQLKGLTRVLKL